MYCKHCREEISDDSGFCRFCGKPLIGGTGETISAGGDAFTGIDTEGMAAIGKGIIQIQIQGMSEEQVRKVISSQLVPILSEIGIKNEIGREPTELTQEQQEIGEAIKEKVNEVDQWFDEPLGTLDTYLKLGNFEYGNKNYKKAIEYYDKIIKVDIKNIKAWFNKGLALSSLKRYDEEIRCYDKALEIDPEYVYAWTGKGDALGKQGRYDAAIRCYDKALEIDPESVYAWTGKGDALGKQGRYDAAIRCYDKALEIDPESVYAWTGKGGALSNALTGKRNAMGDALGSWGRYYEAIRCYDKALEIDPESVYAWTGKGGALSNLGRSGEAFRCYGEVLEIEKLQKRRLTGISR